MDSDNTQPTNPVGSQSTSPNPGPGTAPVSNPNPAPEPTPPTEPTSNPGDFTNPPTPVNTAKGDVVLEAGKKKRKGLIAAIVAIVVVLLAGGGAFAAAYIINNQPANIAASALGNLLSAKQVEVDGSVNISIPDENNTIGISSISLNLDEKNATSGNSATADLQVNLIDGTKVSADIGEVMLSDGTLYLKADGIKDAYYNTFYDQLMNATTSMITTQLQNAAVSDCYASATSSEISITCSEIYNTKLDPTSTTLVNNMATSILDQVGSIIESIDGQWIEISIDDIMSSEMLSTVDNPTRQTITQSYNCTIDKLNNLSNYSDELSSIYSKNPFIVMTAGQDSFYNISFDAANLANYLNAMPQTQIVKDFASCYNTTVPTDTNLGATTENITPVLDYLPQIQAKFDGIFDHHLTELKINQQNDYYSVSSDLKFSYPGNLNISAPANAKPVMEIVNQVYQQIESLSNFSMS